MRVIHEDDGKQKIYSHEMNLDFDWDEISVMAESKKDCIEEMKFKVHKLVEKLSAIDWDKI